MVHYDVPFIPNDEKRCLPVCIGMVLGYFLPGQKFTAKQLDKISGYVPNKGTWSTQNVLSLVEMGFEVRWIEKIDMEGFASDPMGYMEWAYPDPKLLQWHLGFSDLPLEAARAAEYVARGLSLEQREATTQDVTQLLDDGWLPRLKVNAPSLVQQEGYESHSVLAIGYDKTGVYIHNPDVNRGNKANQHVTWAVLEQAWEDYGGPLALQAYRLQNK